VSGEVERGPAQMFLVAEDVPQNFADANDFH
jgi:hypothetical protein